MTDVRRRLARLIAQRLPMAELDALHLVQQALQDAKLVTDEPQKTPGWPTYAEMAHAYDVSWTGDPHQEVRHLYRIASALRLFQRYQPPRAGRWLEQDARYLERTADSYDRVLWAVEQFRGFTNQIVDARMAFEMFDRVRRLVNELRCLGTHLWRDDKCTVSVNY